MKIVEMKKNPGCRREYKIEVDREKVESAINEVFVELKKETIVPGFRRGKAPLPLIMKRFAKEAKTEALRKTLPECAKELMEAEGLKPASDTQLVDYSYEAGQPLKITFEIEFMPEIPVADYKGISVEVETRDVTDEDVEKVLKSAQEANAIYEPKEDENAVIEETDGIVVDHEIRVFVDDKEDEKGRRSSENLFIKDLKQMFSDDELSRLVGKKVGDEVEFERTFGKSDEAEADKTPETEPQDAGGDSEAPAEDSKEEKILYKTKIKEIKSKTLLDIDDEFAKDMGDFKDLEDLKSKIREDLIQKKQENDRTQALSKIGDVLVKNTEFEAPGSIQAGIGDSLIRYDSQRAAMWGTNLDDMLKTEDQRKEYTDQIMSRSGNFAKYHLILGEIAKREEISVSDEDLNKEMAQIGEKDGRKALAIRAELEAEKKLDNFKNDLFVRKVETFLFENANLKYVKKKKSEETEKSS